MDPKNQSQGDNALASAELSQDIRKLLEENSEFLALKKIEDEGKVKVHCSVTGHDLPLNTNEIMNHLGSKRFKKEKEWYSHDFEQYLPYIKPHRHNSKQLYCIVTQRTLNKIPKEVENHVNGRRFKLRRKEWEGRKAQREEEKRLKAEEQEEEGEDGPDFWMPERAEGGSSDEEFFEENASGSSDNGVSADGEERGEANEANHEGEDKEEEEDEMAAFQGDPEDYGPAGTAEPALGGGGGGGGSAAGKKQKTKKRKQAGGSPLPQGSRPPKKKTQIANSINNLMSKKQKHLLVNNDDDVRKETETTAAGSAKKKQSGKNFMKEKKDNTHSSSKKQKHQHKRLMKGKQKKK